MSVGEKPTGDSEERRWNRERANSMPLGVKKYLVFTYYVGRSLGGVKDYLDSFDSVQDALENILIERNRYYQVVDRDTMKTVKEGLSVFKNFAPEKSKTEEGSSGYWPLM